MSKLQVVIQGSAYNIVTEKSREDTGKIVDEINKDIEDYKNRSSKLTTLNATILALINLAEIYDNLTTELKNYKNENDPIIKGYSNLKNDCEKLYQELVVKEANLKQTTRQYNEIKENSEKERNETKKKAEGYPNDVKSQYKKKSSDLNSKLKRERETIDDLKKQIEFYETENNELNSKYKDLKDGYNKLAFEGNKLEDLLIDYQRDEIIDW